MHVYNEGAGRFNGRVAPEVVCELRFAYGVYINAVMGWIKQWGVE